MITYQEYHNAVEQEVTEVLQDEDNKGLDSEDLMELIEDGIANHPFIIYTGKAIGVLYHTRNLEAVEDLGLDLDGGVTDMITKTAMWAMIADAREMFEELYEEPADDEVE